MVACPYGARYLNEAKGGYFTGTVTPAEELLYSKRPRGIVEKCNFCASDIEEGKEPFCVTTCPLRARTFGNLQDPESEVASLLAVRGGFNLLAELQTEPSVFYLL